MPNGRRLVVAENMSANGVIEFVEPWFDPGEQEDHELLEVIGSQMARETALLLGRRTFEDFRGYWPLQTDDTTGFTAHLDRVPKFVVSSTLTDPAWQNTTVLSGPLEDAVRALKAEPGDEIGITGSISVVHALVGTGLIDEYRLFVYPVFTGRGRSLFPDGQAMQGLTLTESRSFRSGVAMLVYR
ncbi:MAG: dihydrofolate reductase family protein, partial [Candidatus Limnocylindrales bacterium]